MELTSQTDYDCFMESGSNMKWLWLTFAASALAVFGYNAYTSHSRDAEADARTRAALESIRHGEVTSLPEIPDLSNPVIDYTRSLQRDTVAAERAAQKYGAAAKAHEQQSQSALDEQ